MPRPDHTSIPLFDEDDGPSLEEAPPTTRVTRATRTARTPSHNINNRDEIKRETQDDLFASTFAGEDNDDEYEPTDDDDAPSRKPRGRASRGPASASKPISADIDEADAELIRMKEAGELLSNISQVLKEKYDLKYEPKSVHSRYIRLKAVLAAQKDQELALGLDSWHEGEDEALLTAYHKANDIIEDEYASLKGRRFIYTARALAELKPGTNYSDHACRMRYRALIAGTASIPPELDDDPDKRAEELAENKMRWIEMQDQKARDELEASERARVIQTRTRKNWHEKLKVAVDRDHDRVLKERERLLAQLADKEKKIAKLEKRKVNRATKLERLANGGDRRATKRPTYKEVEDMNNAALLRHVVGLDDRSASASPAPTKTPSKRTGAAATANARRAIMRKKGSGPFVSEDDSMSEDGAASGASGDEYDPTPRRRRAAKPIRPASGADDEAMGDGSSLGEI